MKEGIHPNYREVVLRGHVQRLQVPSRVRAPDEGNHHLGRGRELPVFGWIPERIAPVLHRHPEVGRQHGGRVEPLPQPFRPQRSKLAA